jgi:hypothetical protein
MVSLLKSKKGALGSLATVFHTVMDLIPTPIKLLLFVFLITALASFMLPLLFGFFGFECIEVGSEDKLFQVPMSNFIENVWTEAKQTVRDFFGFEDYQLPSDPFPGGDQRLLKIHTECFDTVTINGTDVIGYSSACVNCTKSGWNRYANSICLSDGWYDPNLITKYWIGTANFCFRCAPPEPYYFNYSYCIDTDECYYRITDESLVGSVVDEDYEANYYYQRVIELGGVERPQDDSEFVSIQCSDAGYPTLYFFNIEVFNKTLWIYLILVSALIGFAFKWYGLVL